MGVITIAYVMGILPILLGIAFNRVFFVKQYRLADVYVKGYMLLFAGFAAEAILFIYKGKNLPFLTKYWMLTVAVVGVIALVISLRKIPEFLREFCKNAKEIAGRKVGVAMLVIGIGLMLFSIFFVKPLPDASVEYAIAAVDSDQMYYYHPYTLEDHGQFEGGKRIAPVEMFFATLAVQTKIATATIMKLIAPIFLIPLFYGIVWQIGRTLYDKDSREQMEKVCMFVLATIALATIPIYSGNEYLAFAVYRNSWNGLTLLNSMILPYTIVWCLGIFKKIEKRSLAVQDIVMLPVLAMAAQLMQARGAVYVAVIIGVWVIIGVVERICKHGRND